jgi:hypothetical protein
MMTMLRATLEAAAEGPGARPPLAVRRVAKALGLARLPLLQAAAPSPVRGAAQPGAAARAEAAAG